MFKWFSFVKQTFNILTPKKNSRIPNPESWIKDRIPNKDLRLRTWKFTRKTEDISVEKWLTTCYIYT